ncbi:cation diffusion facilitator family transporter [Methanosphaerula palustris]|uniref:Cation diffusion facilitator family transporter n=1 Tax=Methanosphaerula palustris (strain ATCC BAA-1556 / DSM 19958 / E1-9c) TaxID=521011 RepID=B8GEB3_METPE|nr:cation diffusion facilitator family transporter [Methanosphaerula palustris]ACL17614.1 cation diffusion facilitator family transporter [Methanosphaerula palustris E1-9c]
MIHNHDNHEHPGDHDPEHGAGHHGHTHTHGIVDPSILTTERGIWAVKWSFVILFLTAFIQVVIVYYSGSIALFADMIHNLGDALTAIPLLFAFMMARWSPTKRFTYGYGRVEDLAGVFVVLMILTSAIVAGYVSIDRLVHPREVTYLWAVAVAVVVGFIGNEAVARLRIRVGKEIGSAALVADGLHARTDGLTSLAVLVGAVGVYCGFPLVDPIIGLIITITIFWIVWESGKTILTRLLDGVDPAITDEIRHTVDHVDSVLAITDVRVRWLGHRLHAEVNITVDSSLTVENGHAIAKEFQHELLHYLRYLSNATIHVDPATGSGPCFHHIESHHHDGLPEHSH